MSAVPDRDPSAAGRPLTVSVPHRLGRAEAKRRLDTGLTRLRAELGAVVGGLDYRWQGDVLAFNVQAIGQIVNGTVEVLDDVVQIAIRLPWLLRLFGNVIESQARTRTTRLLENRPGEP